MRVNKDGRLAGTATGGRAAAAAVALEPEWAECLDVRARYRGYIEREQRLAANAAALEELMLPEPLWQQPLNGLSAEAREKLRRWRPRSAGQAARIAGVSPADISVLMVHARRHAARAAAEVAADERIGARETLATAESGAPEVR